MQPILNDRCSALLVELGLASLNEKITATPLTGGVASDIASVEVGKLAYCVKFALPKLKVQADWFAPVHRNAAEYEWLKVAASVVPESSVNLFGRSNDLHGFAMEYIEGSDIYLWKSELLAEAPDRGEAAKVGDILGLIHRASTVDGFDGQAFNNRDHFDALRIEPYLRFTAEKHVDTASQLHKIADELYAAKRVLVHGDISPKNILFRSGHPIILDAECATMGDASFDPSFCLNHLILKAIHLPNCCERYLGNVLDFWCAYVEHVDWESTKDLEMRICRLLPMLMLGRIDGKSPVEYLDEAERGVVRALAKTYISSPVGRIADFVDGIKNTLKAKHR